MTRHRQLFSRPRLALPALPGRDHVAFTILATAAPLLAGNLLNSVIGTGMNFWFGKLMGDEAVAVMSVFFPMMFLLAALAMGVTSGATVLAGRAFGAGDAGRLHEVARTSILMVGGFGLLAAALGAIGVDPLIDLLRTPAAIRPQVRIYTLSMMPFLPFLFTFLAVSALLRGTGMNGIALRMVGVIALLTLILAPLLIVATDGLQGYGVASYGAASLVAHGAAIAWVVAHLKKTPGLLRLDASLLSWRRPDWRIAREILHIGLASSFQMILTSLSQISLMALIAVHGASAIAGFGAANQLIGYVQYPAFSVGIAACVLSAQALGAKNYRQLQALAGSAALLAGLLSVVVVAAAYLCARPLLSLFLQNAASMATALRYLDYSLAGLVFAGVAAVLAGILRAMGYVLWPSVISLAAIWGVQVPLAYGLAGTRGPDGIWLSFPIGMVANFVVLLLYFLWVRRKFNAAIGGHSAKE